MNHSFSHRPDVLHFRFCESILGRERVFLSVKVAQFANNRYATRLGAHNVNAMEWADGENRIFFEVIHPSDNIIGGSGAPDIHQPNEMSPKAVNQQRSSRMFPTLYSLDFIWQKKTYTDIRHTLRTHGQTAPSHQRGRNEKQINAGINYKNASSASPARCVLLSLMEVRAAKTTFDENKKKMHRKGVTVRKTIATRSRRM